MSEHKTNGESEASDSEAVPVEQDHGTEASSDDVDQDQSAQGDSKDRKRRRKGGGFVAWFALLLAVASIALASHPFWPASMRLGPKEDTRAEPRPSVAQADFQALAGRVESIENETDAAVDDLRASMAELAEALERSGDEPAAEVSELAGSVEQLSTRLEQLEGKSNTSLAGLRGRLEELETRVGGQLERFERQLSDVGGDLAGADRDVAARLLLIEADSLFAIAQDQLAVLANTDAARQAWERGMERLSALEGPEYTDVKEQARVEFRRLQAFDLPDVGARVERFHILAAEALQWPVRTASPRTEEPPGASDAGWAARLRSAFGDLVKVESADRAFLAPSDVDLVREQLRTTLQTAALALAGSRRGLAEKLVDQAVWQTERVFDTENATVAEALTWLENTEITDSMPQPPSLTATRAEISRVLEDMR